MKFKYLLYILVLFTTAGTPCFSQQDSTRHHHDHHQRPAWYGHDSGARHDSDSFSHHSHSKGFSVGLTLNNLGTNLPGFEVLNGHNGTTALLSQQGVNPKHSLIAFTSGLYMDYPLHRGLSLHTEVGFRYSEVHSIADAPTEHTTWDYSQNMYYIQAGLKKALIRNRRFNLYAGANILFMRRTGMRSESTDEFFNPGSVNGGQHELLTGDDAYALGVNGYVGVNYRLCHRLFIGADLCEAFLYTRVYGMETDHVDFFNGPSSLTYTYPGSSYSEFAFAPVTMAFNLSYHF
jgi:hypothetical protein